MSNGLEAEPIEDLTRAGHVWDNMTLFGFRGQALPSIALFEGD